MLLLAASLIATAAPASAAGVDPCSDKASGAPRLACEAAHLLCVPYHAASRVHWMPPRGARPHHLSRHLELNFSAAMACGEQQREVAPAEAW